MSKPVWKSGNSEIIKRYIEESHGGDEAEQKELSGIAEHCRVPELRAAAARKLKLLKANQLLSHAIQAAKEYRIQPVNIPDYSVYYNPDIDAMLAIMEAREKGDHETAQAKIDSLSGHSGWITDSELFDAAVDTGDLELLSMLAVKIRTLGEWNRRGKALEPLLNTPGFEDVVSHYEELKSEAEKRAEQQAKERGQEWAYTLRLFPGMSLNRQWFDEEPCDYPLNYEDGKSYIDEYFSVSFGKRYDTSVSQVYRRINRFIDLHGDPYNEGALGWFEFANEYEEDDSFADSGVLFQFEDESSVLLTNEEFYDFLEGKCLAYCREHQTSEKTMKHLLLKLKESLKNNHPREAEASQLKSERREGGQAEGDLFRTDKDQRFYFYRKNSDGTVTIEDVYAYRTDVQIPAVLDGHPVSVISGKPLFAPQARLDIPDGIRVIKSQAFAECTISEALVLPAGISIQSQAFEYASLPKTVVIPEGAVLDGDCFSFCETVETLIIGPHATLKGNAFSYSENLRTVVCGPGSRIAENAFSFCYRLERVFLCGDVEIGKDVFQDVEGLKIESAGEEGYSRTLKAAIKEIGKPRQVDKESAQENDGIHQQAQPNRKSLTWILNILLCLLLGGIVIYSIPFLNNKQIDSAPSQERILYSVGDTVELDGLEATILDYTFSRNMGGFDNLVPAKAWEVNLVVVLNLRNCSGDVKELEGFPYNNRDSGYRFRVEYDHNDQIRSSYLDPVSFVNTGASYDDFLLATQFIRPGDALTGKVLNFTLPFTAQDSDHSILLTLYGETVEGEQSVTWLLR